MEKTFKQALCALLVAVMLLSVVPLGDYSFEAEAASFENAIFPAPRVYLTQIAYESYSHGDQNAIDISPGGDVFAPFSGTIVQKDANWGFILLQSNNKVYYADGTLDYMTVGFMHDSNISDLSVGQKINQGQNFYQAGGMGNGNPNAYGAHVHITVLKGKINSVTSSYGKGNVYAYNAFYVNTTKTQIAHAGVLVSGNHVNNGAPSNYNGLWKTTTLSSRPEPKEIKPTDGEVYKIASAVGSDKYLDFALTSINVQIYENCDNHSDPAFVKSQYFIISLAGDGWYTIKNTGNGKLVDVALGNPASGTNVQQCAANGGNAQLYKFFDAGDGYCYIQSKLGCYLDVYGATNANGTNVQMYEFNGSNAQKWKLVSHSHTNNSDITKNPTCTSEGTKTHTCNKCGISSTETVPATGHKFDTWVPVAEATCTTEGSQKSNCTLCGKEEIKSSPALGHDYNTEDIPANCQEYAGKKYTCKRCNHSYNEENAKNFSEWSTAYPEGIDKNLIESKTQYRYSDYQTKTSSDSSMSGYTLSKSEWVKDSAKVRKYVPSWPSGYPTTSDFYKKYNKAPVKNSEDATTKIVAQEPVHYQYIYYHWCRGTYKNGPINRKTSPSKTSEFCKYHAFTSTTDPNTLTTAGDGSRTIPRESLCKDSHWYYPVEMYKQSYTIYKKLNTFERWTDFSDWSDTIVQGSDTRKVETRIVYRYVTSKLGNHVETVIPGKAATCAEKGLTEGKKCSVCGTITVAQTELPVLTHKDDNGDFKCDFNCGYEYEKPTAAPSAPEESTTKSTETTVPVETTTKPAETTVPAETTTKPAETTAPAETTTKPAETTAPTETTTKPAETTAPAETTTKPAETTAPAETTTKPAETTAPVEPTTKPAETEEPATKPEDTTNKESSEKEPEEVTLARVEGLKVKKTTVSLIKISWKAVEGAEKYKVYYSTNGKKWKVKISTDNVETVKKLKNGTTYRFKVKAIAGDVEGEISKVIKTATRVEAVVLESVKSNKKSQVTVNWERTDSANGYVVEYSTSKKFTKKTTKKATIKKGKTIKTTLKNLKSGKKYYVRVKAYKTVNSKKVYGAKSGTYSVKVK